MNADIRTSRRAPTPGRRLALLLAVIVHAAFIAVLVFSVRWQSHPPEPVVAELYAPSPQQPRAAPAPVEPPAPAPVPVPVPAPQPVPQPAPQPAPAPPKADDRAAEIAMKAKADEKRRQVEAAERQRAEEQRRADEKRAADKRAADAKVAEEQKAAETKKAADARDRQQRALAQMREQAEKDLQAQANAETSARAQEARKSAESDYSARIRAKIRGNVIVPPDLAGNPQADFDVVQLPSGEIIDTRLVKSSGSKSYDDAVQRAILKSSPLPRPDRADLFKRELRLQFRPND